MTSNPGENDYPRHPEYYIRTADLHILARGTRFRVHSSFLIRESLWWKNKIAGTDSSKDGQRALGWHESVPLLLDEKPRDFAAFLWVFYNPRYSIYDTSPKQWITILRLATKWECPDIRGFAISHIKTTSLSAVKKIKILREYGTPHADLLPLLVELASREQMLTREEFRVLDDDTKFHIVRAREMLRASPHAEGSNSPTTPHPRRLSDTEKSQIVAEAVGVPLPAFDSNAQSVASNVSDDSSVDNSSASSVSSQGSHEN